MMNQSTLMLVILPLFILQIILMVTALISLVKQERIKGPKWLWALIIICFNIIGPIVYFIVGRKDQ